MRTPEERLNVVEHSFKQIRTETIKAYQDMAMELGVIKGLTDASIGRLKAISTQVAEIRQDINDRFDWTDQRFDTLNQQVYELGQDIKAVRQDSRIETLEQNMNSRFEQVDKRFETQSQLLQQILERLPKQ
jgi:DNA anti-recombination protein RmuC